MSSGGFVYKFYQIGSWEDSDPERFSSALSDICDLFVSSGQGWSVHREPSEYGPGLSAHFAVLSHTGGSRLALGLSGHSNSNKFGFPSDRVAMNLYSSQNGLWFSYLPPSPGVDFGSTPLSDDFLPIEALPVYTCCHSATSGDYMFNYESLSSTYSILNFGIKGESFWYCARIRAGSDPSIDTFLLSGKILSVVENDTGVNVNNGYASFVSNSLTAAGSAHNSSYTYSSFFRERDGRDGSRARIRDDGVRSTGVGSVLGEGLHNPTVGNDLRWEGVMLYMESPNISTDGVIPGDGVRGLIDPDYLRAVRSEHSVEGMLVDGGNMISLGKGLCVGWDPSNPALAVPN